MQLVQMGRYFIDGEERNGCGMTILNEDGKTILRYEGEKIATISDRTEDGCTLTLHSQHRRYTTIGLCNRFSAVFHGINNSWSLRRYSASRRYDRVRIHDSKLGLDLTLLKDTSFTIKGRVPSLNYSDLEAAFLSDSPKVEILPTPATTNTNEALNNLMALVADI